MLQALLHGKLSREESRLEDLLTSNVFGLLRYLDSDDILARWLSLAFNPVSGSGFASVCKLPVRVAHWRFWPRLVVRTCLPAEPDVELMLVGADGKQVHVLIEAKYHSGKSSEPSDDELPPCDQLAREYDNLAMMAGGLPRAVIYLTADIAAPIEAIRASENEFHAKRGSHPSIYWLSWRHLADVLGSVQSVSPIVVDLVALLEMLDLTMFRRLRLPEVEARWRFEPSQSRWQWTVPLVRWCFVPTKADMGFRPLPNAQRSYQWKA